MRFPFEDLCRSLELLENAVFGRCRLQGLSGFAGKLSALANKSLLMCSKQAVWRADDGYGSEEIAKGFKEDFPIGPDVAWYLTSKKLAVATSSQP